MKNIFSTNLISFSWKTLQLATISVVLIATVTLSQAATSAYFDRTAFDAVTGKQVIDTYAIADYGGTGQERVLDGVQMTAAINETIYIGPEFFHLEERVELLENATLDFSQTSVNTGLGIFGFGMDVDLPSEGSAYVRFEITYGDGSVETFEPIIIPYTGFFGFTSDSLIQSVRIVPSKLALSFDNFTTAAPGVPVYAYSGDHGPGFWHEINEACAGDPDGSLFRQSPINIKHVVPNRHLKPLVLDLLDHKIHLKNNGHTIDQEYENGSSLTWEGVEYELVQFHFHTLSEHVVRRERSAMEMHAVFSNEDGELVVIGKLFKIAHKKNAFLEELIEASLPEKNGDVTEDQTLINLEDGLGSTKSYYTYKGSLTTPPCSPIVTWVVLKNSGKMSKEQFHAFRDIMGNNFRPLQPLKQRIVEATVKERWHKP